MGKTKKKNRRSDADLQDVVTPEINTKLIEPTSAPHELIERLGKYVSTRAAAVLPRGTTTLGQALTVCDCRTPNSSFEPWINARYPR